MKYTYCLPKHNVYCQEMYNLLFNEIFERIFLKESAVERIKEIQSKAEEMLAEQ